MVDPMNALVKLQEALDDHIVSLRPCEIYSDLGVIFDQPRDRPRFTYAKVVSGKVLAVAQFVLVAPVEGMPCFQLGISVIEEMRRKGLATEVLSKGMEELRNGLRRNGGERFYVEAVVSISNEPSNRLAKRLLSDAPTQCTDSESGQPALQYLRMIT